MTLQNSHGIPIIDLKYRTPLLFTLTDFNPSFYQGYKWTTVLFLSLCPILPFRELHILLHVVPVKLSVKGPTSLATKLGPDPTTGLSGHLTCPSI